MQDEDISSGSDFDDDDDPDKIEVPGMIFVCFLQSFLFSLQIGIGKEFRRAD